jgi:hypothetical protein
MPRNCWLNVARRLRIYWREEFSRRWGTASRRGMGRGGCRCHRTGNSSRSRGITVCGPVRGPSIPVGRSAKRECKFNERPDSGAKEKTK